MNANRVYLSESSSDASIWVGGAPAPRTHELLNHKITCVVTTASAYPFKYPVFVHRTNLRDDAFGIVSGDEQRAMMAAEWVAQQVRQGRSVLVLCREGLNRSAWVAALAISLLEPEKSGDQLIEMVQAARPGALYNFFFCEDLRGRRPARNPVGPGGSE